MTLSFEAEQFFLRSWECSEKLLGVQFAQLKNEHYKCAL